MNNSSTIMNRVTKDTLRLRDFVDFASGLHLREDLIEVHRRVILGISDEFIISPNFHGVGIRYIKGGLHMIPVFEIWHHDMDKVHFLVKVVLENNKLSQDYPVCSRNTKLSPKLIPPQRGLIKEIYGEMNDFKEQVPDGLFFLPSGDVKKAVTMPPRARTGEIQATLFE